MSVHDVWLRDTLSRYAIIAVTAVLVIVWVKVKWPKFKQYVYKSYLVGFEAECAQLALPYKTNLFRLIERQQSQDASLRSVGKIRILEIGVKTGENIQYYPHGAHVICVDWNRKLEEYLVNGNCCNKFAHIVLENLVIGDGTCMKNVADGSVDIVVSTRSLCSTASISKTLKEIKRVMAPTIIQQYIRADARFTLTSSLLLIRLTANTYRSNSKMRFAILCILIAMIVAVAQAQFGGGFNMGGGGGNYGASGGMGGYGRNGYGNGRNENSMYGAGYGNRGMGGMRGGYM